MSRVGSGGPEVFAKRIAMRERLGRSRRSRAADVVVILTSAAVGSPRRPRQQRSVGTAAAVAEHFGRLPTAFRCGLNFASSIGIGGSGPAALARLRAAPAEAIRGQNNMLALLVTTMVPLALTKLASEITNIVLGR